MKSLYLVGIILTILIGSFFNWILCCEATETVSAPSTVAPKEIAPVVNPLVIKDNTGNFNYRTNDNYNFNKSNYIILRPLGEGVGAGILKLKDYINTEDGKFIDVTGYYSVSEKNTSAFPNLGLARAHAVKNHLIAQGISSKKINTYGELSPNLKIQDSIYIGPVDFTVTADSNFADAETVIEDIKKNPIVLYFDTGKSTISLTDEQRAKYSTIVQAMDKIDDIAVQIIGHTDNTGNPENNMVLGKDRAEYIKEYLVRNGISSEDIETISMGQTKPIATNDTEEGRAKNRRTVITIKN
ncbi:OmpA family protein [Joostella sp. CR20]|uniref:OmpA family protein n=1 Tax=Joostella sp. CR20 TaxID=2804312 RepID=UPI00313E37BD